MFSRNIILDYSIDMTDADTSALRNRTFGAQAAGFCICIIKNNIILKQYIGRAAAHAPGHYLPSMAGK
jgi:hypothetical protein